MLRKKSVQARKPKYALLLYSKDEQRGVVAFENFVTRSKTAIKGGMCSAPDPVDWDKLLTKGTVLSSLNLEVFDSFSFLYNFQHVPVFLSFLKATPVTK